MNNIKTANLYFWALVLSCTTYGNDSNWVSLYNGNFDNLKIYFKGQGYIADATKQKVFVATPNLIHVVKGTNGLIATKKQYSHYIVQVTYRWAKTDNSHKNAGIMTHVNINSKVTKDNRPQSVECNMRNDQPGSIWLARNLGPFGSSYVDPTPRSYLPQKLGGKLTLGAPFKDPDRTIFGYYKNGKLPTKPDGEWNLYQVIVRGSDSLEIRINGLLTNRLYDIRDLGENQKPGVALNKGSIGLQSEDFEIYYKDFKVLELDPTTGSPLGSTHVTGCPDSVYLEYNPKRTNDDISLCLTACPNKNFKEFRATRAKDDTKLCKTTTTKTSVQNFLQKTTIIKMPSKLIVYLTYQSDYLVKILKISGELVSSQLINNSKKLSISTTSLPTGMYTVQVSEKGSTIISKQYFLNLGY